MSRVQTRSGFSSVEIDAMLAAAPTRCWRAFIAVCSGCHLSTREALWLAWRDIDFDHAAIMVVSTTIAADDGAYEVPRPYWPWSRQRVVSLPACASEALRAFLGGPATGPLVFVPDWRLDAVWLQLDTPSRIRPEQLVPGLREGFRMVQRLAQLELARKLDVPLAVINWPLRPLSALTRPWSPRPSHAAPSATRERCASSPGTADLELEPRRCACGQHAMPDADQEDSKSRRGAP